MLNGSEFYGGVLINCCDFVCYFEGCMCEVELDQFVLSDLEFIVIGGYSLLIGFLGEKDYYIVVKEMRLVNGLLWSLLIMLFVGEEMVNKLFVGDCVKFVKNGVIYGMIIVIDIYQFDKI